MLSHKTLVFGTTQFVSHRIGDGEFGNTMLRYGSRKTQPLHTAVLKQREHLETEKQGPVRVPLY